MRKWTLGWIGLGAVVLGLLVWGFFSLGIRRPVTRIVHVNTPGGIVPLCLVFLDEESAYIDVGYEPSFRSSRLETGPGHEMVVREITWLPLRFEIEFPKHDVKLSAQAVASDGERHTLEGHLVIEQHDGTESEYRISTPRVMQTNWFDPADTPRPSELGAYFGGRWRLEFSSGDQPVYLHIETAYKAKDQTRLPTVDGYLLTFITHHQIFKGRVDGSSIRLASFDQAVPAIIDATMQDDGTLMGDLWVGDRLHESFTARLE